MKQVLVCVATYRRVAWLQELLVALGAQRPSGEWQVSYVIVDNDPGASASGVDLTSLPGAVLLHEPQPGIAAARNRALEVAAERNPDALVFIDDDELPSPNWLAALTDALERYDATAVIGPVVSVLPGSTPAALRQPGFFDSIRLPSGARSPWGTTNNTIVRWRAIASLAEPRFDEDFSVTGGSDAELFWRIQQTGGLIAWCDEAIVTERFSSERATWRWLIRRNVRLGNVSARLKLRTRRRPVILLIGLLRALYGTGCTIASLLTGHGVQAAGFAHLFKGIGMVGECLLVRVVEYRRPGSSTRTAIDGPAK